MLKRRQMCTAECAKILRRYNEMRLTSNDQRRRPSPTPKYRGSGLKRLTRRTLLAAIAGLNRRVSHTLPAAIAARFGIGYRNQFSFPSLVPDPGRQGVIGKLIHSSSCASQWQSSIETRVVVLSFGNLSTTAAIFSFVDSVSFISVINFCTIISA